VGASISLTVAYLVSLSVPSGVTVSIATADATLLAEYLWRTAKARGIIGADGAHLAQRIADALVSSRTVEVDPADLPALTLALERLGMALRLTTALRSLQDAVSS
jgi:hypothetical protein